MGWKNYLIVPVLALVLAMGGGEGPSRRYFKAPFDPASVVRLEKHLFQFNDTIPNDTVYICFDRKNLPIAYYREIMSGVCLDGECRPVYLNLYWSISGGYLGYELKNNEILTKNDHDPFSGKDYAKLHELLSDPISLLADYTLAEMTPKPTESVSVDAHSGATLADLTPYIVKGAAYTTHTLWHIVHDDTRDSLQRLSDQFVSFPLLSRLLTSPGTYDQLWAVKQIPKLGDEAEKLLPDAKDILQSNNYFLKEQVLRALTASTMKSLIMQETLYEVYLAADFGTKRMIVNMLESVPAIEMEVARRFVKNLPAEDNTQISLIFDLLKKRADPDQSLLREISDYLDGSNEFLATASYAYLSPMKNKEPWLVASLKRYHP